MSVVVAGFSQPDGGDLDFGRIVVERLGQEELPGGVIVEALSPSAVNVAGRLRDLRPRTLILVAAVPRGRAPGKVQRRLEGFDEPSSSGTEAAMGSDDSAADGLLRPALESSFSPARVVVVEVEPASAAPSAELSPEVADALEEALHLILADIRRAPLLDLARELRDVMTSDPLEPTPVVEAVEALLGELQGLEREGRWGRTFAERDRLRLRISSGEHAGDAVGGVHWAMWWGLIEELDRLQALEASAPS